MKPQTNDRAYWLHILKRLADPVLEAGAAGVLPTALPVAPGREDRQPFAALEAAGRLLCGIAPWLESKDLQGEEEALRMRYANLARQTIIAGVDPSSPGFFNFKGHQSVVDTAFLAHAMLRAPEELWEKLPAAAKANVVAAIMTTRERKPPFCNWLLFSATTEAFFYKTGNTWDRMRVDYALRKHAEWYVGDGMYSDGPEFHFDYYNSFVIQPMLIDILNLVGELDATWGALQKKVVHRAVRYSAIQERLISPEGTFPPVGRSLAYRFGAFQLLAQMALRRQLPDDVKPAQVRCALTAVIERMMEASGTFDRDGWLTIGFCGNQPGLGENYISVGSLYLCAAGLLPMGLPPEDPFWSDPDQPWTSKKIWEGMDAPCDHALHEG